MVVEWIRTADEIYKSVSNYYKNKGLEKDEFSNRLKVIGDIIAGDSLSDGINFLDMREHWWEYEKVARANMKSRTRSQIKAILKRLDLQLGKEGLRDLREE